MLALSLQTLLLMSAAYCLGAALACLVRRSFFAGTARAARGVARHVEPLPEVDPDVTGARRFVRAGLEAGSTPSPQPAPAAAPRPAPAQAQAGAPQDLKRIHAIDAATEAALNRLGIHRYDAIGRWLRGDLERIAQALGIRRQRMNQENWIEQAQMLATGVETHYARRRARGETANATPSADQGERRRLVAQPPPAASPPLAPTRRAAPSLAAAARGAAAPARASTGIPASVSPPPKVSERAAFARAPSASSRSEPVAGPAAALPSRSPVTSTPPPTPPTPPAAAIAAATQATPSAIEAARPVRPAPAGADNLQRIRGIDAPTAQRLAAAGVSRYAEIAAWSAAEVSRFDRDLAAEGRIARENWIEQAQILMRGGDTK